MVWRLEVPGLEQGRSSCAWLIGAKVLPNKQGMFHSYLDKQEGNLGKLPQGPGHQNIKSLGKRASCHVSLRHLGESTTPDDKNI